MFLFGKIEGSLQKYHIVLLNVSINSCKSLLKLGIDWLWNIQYTNMHFNTIEQCRMVFSKYINNLQSWTKLSRQNRKSIFQWKTPLPQNQCCWQRFRLLTTKLDQIQHWYWGLRGEFGIWTIESFLEFNGFSTFVSASFVQGCGKFWKHKH